MPGTTHSDESEKGYYPHNTHGDDGYTSEILPQHTGIKGFWYHPLNQAILLGFVCFMCPGLFNALNGLGAGGQVDSTTSANANSTLYATFAVGAFFAGYATISC
ncbi:hypothetical protein H0H87_011967 [Tephrocybe sp. NHM501043]|nr:hypothetical protein H0H87_011967 [Tephrocybe sp. NHM501043]